MSRPVSVSQKRYLTSSESPYHILIGEPLSMEKEEDNVSETHSQRKYRILKPKPTTQKRKKNKNTVISRLRRGSAAVLTGARRRSKLVAKASNKNIFRLNSYDLNAKPSHLDTANSIREADAPRKSLHEKIQERLFNKELSAKKYTDIIRTAHCMKLLIKAEDEKEKVFDASELITEEIEPNKHVREMSRMILIIEQLLLYFSKTCVEKNNSDVEINCELMVKYIHEFVERFMNKEIAKKQFNLSFLFEEMEVYFDSVLINKVKDTLKFVSLSVVIFSIEELRHKLDLGIDYITKDVDWNINISLTPRNIQVSHTRRECVLKQRNEENYWEIKYNITLSFDAEMTQFFAVRLALKDLILSENMSFELRQDLKAKFFNGNFTVC